MKKTRSELREIIMKILYQFFLLQDTKLDYDINDIIHEQIDIDNEFVNTVVNGVIENLEDLKNLANKYLDNWKINRFNYVDQAIICMSIYELKYMDTPVIVTINEAIELAKKYSDESICKIINAILDKIYHEEVNNE